MNDAHMNQDDNVIILEEANGTRRNKERNRGKLKHLKNWRHKDRGSDDDYHNGSHTSRSWVTFQRPRPFEIKCICMERYGKMNGFT